ncbi:MAG: hypothetical protein E7088_01325 [Bacteroidales bacterium]|nr:hypothetical protein [Bacteroidales bacterium]
MNTLQRTMAMLLLAIVAVACSSDDEIKPQPLEVTPNNVSGIWALASVNDEPLPDGLFCYIEFVRRTREFTMYQKFDSMYPRRITGTFAIENDEYKGALLSGKYDFGAGAWNNSYIVTSLFENSMVLTVDAENGEVCKYVRCSAVPEDILGMFE